MSDASSGGMQPEPEKKPEKKRSRSKDKKKEHKKDKKEHKTHHSKVAKAEVEQVLPPKPKKKKTNED